MKVKLGVGMAAVTIGVLVGCSSPPIAPMPDGEDRVPANRTGRVEVIKSDQTERAAKAEAESAAMAAVRVLGAEVDRIKRHLVLLSAAILEGSKDAAARGAQKSAKESGEPGERVLGQTWGANESTEVRPRSTVFRVRHRVGQATFVPSVEMAAALRKAASVSERIEVRGRTDAVTWSAGDERVARERASRARAWLIAQGVPETRIFASSLASGDPIGASETPAGRAVNRRVEIEVMTVGTDAGERTRNDGD